MKTRKSKTRKSKTRKSKTKKSKTKKFGFYSEKINKNELDLIKKNMLISLTNINKSSKETLLNSGITLKNVGGVIYFKYDPLALTPIGICSTIMYLFSPCLTTIISNLYKNNSIIEKIIKKKFNRFMGYFDIEKDEGGDTMFQMKLLRYIINDNILIHFNKLNKKKIIKYFDELIEFRNQIAHQTYKKLDYKITINKSKKKSNLTRLNKFRNINYIKQNIDKMLYILKEFYNIKENLGKNTKINIIKRNYVALKKMKLILNNICLINERRTRMFKLIKNEKKVNKVAKTTLDYLNKKLSSKNKKISDYTARNIVNLITSRLTNDDVFISEFGNQISNKNCLKYCKST